METMEPEVVMADYPAIPIYRYIEMHAAARPTAIAVTFAEEQLTYEELNRRANQLAHYLSAAGVGPEARVAVCLRPSAEVAVALLAILKAGGVYVPLDPNDPAERVATILDDVQPTAILTQSYLTSNLPASASVCLFCFDADSDKLKSYPPLNLTTEPVFEQTAYVVYTSGTTGKPKGVMASHHNLIHYILSSHDRYGFREQDVMPALARFTFSISLFELL
ncbi:MAG TPA: AMP-binding protein, partial [Chthoniobacterales bacterium]